METNQKPLMPENYLVWAILATVFCCLPFGIVSILKANNVSNFYAQGLYAQAQQASKDAKKWAIIAACTGIAGILIYVILMIIGVAASGALNQF